MPAVSAHMTRDKPPPSPLPGAGFLMSDVRFSTNPFDGCASWEGNRWAYVPQMQKKGGAQVNGARMISLRWLSFVILSCLI